MDSAPNAELVGLRSLSLCLEKHGRDAAADTAVRRADVLHMELLLGLPVLYEAQHAPVRAFLVALEVVPRQEEQRAAQARRLVRVRREPGTHGHHVLVCIVVSTLMSSLDML